MLDRIVQGAVPRKHHLAFRGTGGNLLHEEAFTREGFEGPYTLLYHLDRPHAQRSVETSHGFTLPVAAPPGKLLKRHYRTPELPARRGPAIDVRVPLLFNADVVVGLVTPGEADPVYFANGDGDDLFYVFEGGGLLRSTLGDLRFEKDD